MVKIQINLTNKWLYFIVGVLIISVFGVSVWAYNAAGTGGNPAIMGHSADEIQGSGGSLSCVTKDVEAPNQRTFVYISCDTGYVRTGFVMKCDSNANTALAGNPTVGFAEPFDVQGARGMCYYAEDHDTYDHRLYLTCCKNV